MCSFLITFCDRIFFKQDKSIKSKLNFKSKAKVFYKTEDASESESEQSPSNEESEIESQEPDPDNLTMMSLYKLSDDGNSINAQSSKLPIFNAKLNDSHSTKTILDIDATTLYIDEEIARKLGAKITKITSRKIRVANKEIITTTSIYTIEMKLDGLSSEMIIAYVFSLHKIDLILDLSWLQKHNSHVDFRDICYEFTRNEYQYYIYPSTL